MLGLVIAGTVTGSLVSINFEMQELDPVGQTSTMSAPGNSVSMGPYSSTGHTNYIEMICFTGAVLVSWSVVGTSPSFGGVDLWVRTSAATFSYGLTQPGVQVLLPTGLLLQATRF